MRWRSPVLARRTAAAVVLALLAAPARASDRASFTVGAQVVRSARVSVSASPARGGLHLEAHVDRGAGRQPAGVALGDAAALRMSPLLAAISPAGGGETLVVTVLTDGGPISLSIRD
jgi:hypothetical protein